MTELKIFKAEEADRLRRLMRQAFADKQWRVALFFLLAYPFLLKIAMNLRSQEHRKTSDVHSPFTYTMH